MQAPEVPPVRPAAAPVLPPDEEPLLPVEDEPPLPVLPVPALPALPVDGFAPPFASELPDDEAQAKVPHKTKPRKALNAGPAVWLQARLPPAALVEARLPPRHYSRAVRGQQSE